MKLAKFLFLTLFITFQSIISLAQPGSNWMEKITWKFKLEKIDDKTANIIGSATIIEGWHVFSVNHDPSKADFTGVPTSFIFKSSPNFKLVGKIKDLGKPVVHKDELGTSLYFEKKASFIQKIEILTDKAFDLVFDYSFQICDENGCVFPPDQTVKLKVEGFNKISPAVPLNPDTSTAQTTVDKDTVGKSSSDTLATNSKEEAVSSTKKVAPTRSNWGLFWEGLGWGFFAIFTPCVFPMIPMTVSFFTKQSKSRSKGIINAVLYGLSIIGIYVGVGILITLLTKSPETVYLISTSATLNLIFFAIFMIFAFSFLGAFEIQVPNSWINKADQKADRGGFIGVFFMAFTLVLVSFSCTGPIIGSSLVQAVSSGSISGPVFIMLGFSVALALPFMLFAIFPSWLNSMPSSGGWLNSVKVVLGLLEIALSLKFLSMVDLTYHWNILTREIFVAIWFVVFAVMGFYLLGKIRFSHDSPVEKVSVPRFMFSLSALVFAVYLLPGMWGAPLFMIDGIAPPRTHSEDNFRFVKGNSEVESSDENFIAYRQFMHEVGDGSILVFHDLEKGREYAKKVNKPILIDFTGYSCANCRKTESKVWTNEKIRSMLQNEVVVVSLYCDDRTELPAKEQVYSKAINGKMKYIGNKWSAYQIEKYGQLTQPLYIVQDLDGNDLTDAIGYTPDIDAYQKFLRNGIDGFKK
ncbi:MAG: cytochrome c biogenesis protein CcdA [Bacteroidota bacterium]